jgi:hypothetical protein
MNLDLCDSSANGTAICARSSSDIAMRSISRSDSSSSSTPRNAHEIYQSHTTRRTTRPKKCCHSSSVGGPAFAVLVAVSGALLERPRPRGGSMASGSSGTIIASTISLVLSGSSSAELVSSPSCSATISCSISGVIPRASIASGVSPAVSGRIGGMGYHHFRRFICSAS